MTALSTLRTCVEAARLERERAEGLLAQANAGYDVVRAANSAFGGKEAREARFAAAMRQSVAWLAVNAARATERRARIALCRCNTLRLAR